MKKELLGAILIGVVVGLFVVVGIYQARQAVLVGVTPLNPSPTAAVIQSSTGAVQFVHPSANAILTTSSTTLTASSSFPETPYVLLVNETPYLGKTDTGGNLSQSIRLTEGANFLQLELIRSDGRIERAEQVIAHYTALPEATTSAQQLNPSPTPRATGSASPRPTPKVSPSPRSTP